MPKISQSKGRSDENSGYTRLMGNPKLGHLLSQIQATVIRSGNELENILAQLTPRKASLNQALGQALMRQHDVEVVFGPTLLFLENYAIKADILVVSHISRSCKVIEVKDGDTFDTKKASGELESLKRFAAEISRQIGYASTYHFCSFNQPDKNAIVRGAKGRFSIEEVMTGRELCELLGISFDHIIEYRILGSICKL